MIYLTDEDEQGHSIVEVYVLEQGYSDLDG